MHIISTNNCRYVQVGETGGAVYDAAIFLCNFLIQLRKSGTFNFPDITVLELGAGTGLASIVTAHLGAKVVCTDGDKSAVELARKNCEINLGSNSKYPIIVRHYRWGDIDNDLEQYGPFNMVIGSDLLYIHSHLWLLKESLLRLCDAGGHLVLAFQIREKKKELDFIQELKEHFQVEAEQVDSISDTNKQQLMLVHFKKKTCLEFDESFHFK